MEPIVLTPTAADAGARIDSYLASAIEGLSRSAAQHLLEDGAVLADGKPVVKKYKLTGRETLSVVLPEPEETLPEPENIPLDIVYEDEDVLVVNKPVGMVVHPAPGHHSGTLVNALLYHCGEHLSDLNGELRPGIVHRIDRDTSGLLLVAKNNEAHAFLAAQLEDHTVSRVYDAVCVGGFREDSGIVDAPIGRHHTDRKKMAITETGRRAVTHWEVIERYPGFTHVRCHLETGRTHQIRVHLAHIGHPLLGDTIYGAKKPVAGLAGQCLHASELSFLHPRTKQMMTVTCPLPEWFQKVLRRLENRR